VGHDTLIGQTAVATDSIYPEAQATGGDAGHGQVMVHGELWQASSTTPIHKGDKVRVTSRKGLLLFVERLP
jgi:membrane-bound ClpP family serine protease